METKMKSFLFRLLYAACVVSSIATTALQPATSIDRLYSQARDTRIASGHDAAQPIYAEILKTNPFDLTVATRLAAASSDDNLRSACTCTDTASLEACGNWLAEANFTAAAVGEMLCTTASLNCTAAAPIYITPAAPGTVQRRFPVSDTLQCLTALFLLGIAVPAVAVEQSQLLLSLGLVCCCEYDESLLFAPVSIMPIEVGQVGGSSTTAAARTTLYVATDWHPRVLNCIAITETEETVMYIGPDSLALIEHWILGPQASPASPAESGCLLDVCSGSGVQALTCLATGKCRTAICLDTNPRALRFTAFSAALNGLSDLVTLVQGDLLHLTGRLYDNSSTEKEAPLTELLRDLRRRRTPPGSLESPYYNMLTANPPFLPVPQKAHHRASDDSTTSSEMVAARYGLFSAGGSNGEAVIAAILALSNKLLADGSFCALVSEFFFQEGKDSADVLLARLQSYWSGSNTTNNEATEYSGSASCKGLLLTNQFPISAALYAERRAETAGEATFWETHLSRENIATCSPGLLYVQKLPFAATSKTKTSSWAHRQVPKSEQGSIWTPGNRNGVLFTQSACRGFFRMHPTSGSTAQECH